MIHNAPWSGLAFPIVGAGAIWLSYRRNLSFSVIIERSRVNCVLIVTALSDGGDIEEKYPITETVCFAKLKIKGNKKNFSPAAFCCCSVYLG